MPRFYLHLFEGDLRFDDPEGIEVSDPEAARRAAIHGLRDTICSGIWNGELDLGCCIAVEDEGRHEVDRVRFADAVRITNEATPGKS